VLGRVPIAWAATVLLFATVVQAIVYRYASNWQLERPRLTALLAFASVAVALYAALGGAWQRGRTNLQAVLGWSSLAASIAATGLLAAVAPATSATPLAGHLAWLAVIWLVLGALGRWPVLLIASQAALVLAIMCGVTAAVENREWYLAARHPWLDPWFLEAQGIALVGYCLLMIAVRRQWNKVSNSDAAGWPIAKTVEIGLVLLLAAIATYAVLPGAAQELEPLEAARGTAPAVRVVTPIENFEMAGIAHARAGDRGGWALLAAVAMLMSAGLWERRSDWRIVGLVVALVAVCALLAARWEPDVAVASALRWLTAGFFVAGSAAIWMLNPRSAISAAEMPGFGRIARDYMVATIVLVYVVIGTYVFQAALWRAGLARGTEWMWPYALVWTLAAGAAALLVGGATRATQHMQQSWRLHARDVLLLLAGAPLVILLTFAVARALDQHPIVGPEPTSWFRRIGWDVSYGVPLAVIGLALVGHAIRDRSSRFAFAAGLLFNTVATIVVLMRLARGGGSLDAAAWITVAQVNAIVAGAVALAWMAAVHVAEFLRDSDHKAETFRGSHSSGEVHVSEGSNSRLGETRLHWPLLLVTQVALATALCGAFLVPSVVNLALRPANFTWAGTADGVLGWLAAALATTAAVWMNRRRTISQAGCGIFVAALIALVALTATRWDTGNWLAYHTLLVGSCAAAWLLPVATRAANRAVGNDAEASGPLVWSALPARLFAAAAVFLAFVELFNRPGGLRWGLGIPWWPIAAFVAIAARNVWIAWHELRPGFIWIAGILFNIAMSTWWEETGYRLTGSTGELTQFLEFLWVNVLAVASMALVSVWVGRRYNLSRDNEVAPPRRIAFHRFAAWAIVVVLLGTTAAGLIADLFNESFAVSLPLAWTAWLAAAIVALACNWDPAVRWPVACLYCVGLVGVGMFLDGLDFQAPMFHWALTLALAAYSLATSAMWSARERLRAVAMKLGMPTVEIAGTDISETGGTEFRRNSVTWEGSGHGWLVPMNLLLGVAVLLLVVWIETSMERFTERMVAAYAVGAQAIALGLLARGTVRTPLQYLALVWGVLFAVAFGWAWLRPDFPAPWLHRLVVTVAALAVMVVVYGFGLVKFLRRENEWTRAAARLMPPLAGIAVALILCVLGIETAAFLRGAAVPIHPAASMAIILALVGLAAAALVAALVPGRDPFGLSERGRTVYVYTAEALAALLFLHIRVTMPWLFRGWFLRFWPLVVMLVAFVGVGLGELFDRRRQRVLSEPLQNTGALLPLLPALGFWILSSEVHYSLLLLSIGVLYAALSALRQSFLYGMLAAIAANGSLWYLLYRGDGLGLFEHPQLWLIPPALSLLAAGYINRERLSAEQMAALRYFAAIVIYVSSTADVFINGVAEAPWLPAVLAGLSILGVLAGILLRVRAFLYLGTAFLVVALMTIIWNAAIHQQRTWILWVAGIVTGVAIIALFGLFEKRRDDVLRVVEQLKHWEA
jgi:hypothetical protein